MNALLAHIGIGDFETLYLKLRESEKRVYTDEELRSLPEVRSGHPHYHEWQLRKLSCQKLVSYVQKKASSRQDGQTLKILEIGCGNGWLARRLSDIPGCSIIGTDINFTELQQAATVFQDRSNLHFIYSYPGSNIFEKGQFDMIVFAASIQYFPSLKEIVNGSKQLLNANGEIHIIDSYFYPESELVAARQRSLNYFEAAGFGEMANWYFHHSWKDLGAFHYSVLYNPGGLFKRLLKNKIPFPWVCIK